MKKIQLTCLILFCYVLFTGCSNKVNEKTTDKVTQKAEAKAVIKKEKTQKSTKNGSTVDSLVKSEKLTLTKEDIYGKKFTGTTDNPQTEITFTFADTNFDFMEGDVLSYYRNITESDYETERTKGIQFENMTINIDNNNYVVKSYNAGSEAVHTFKKIDNSTITWISDNKEVMLHLVDTSNKEEQKREITTEDLMNDYHPWTLESGITPAAYNEERKNEANRRLVEKGLPEDNDFINRTPIIIDRETEREVHKMVGNLDYIPVEANKVINGVIVKE
ncbi:hypothetical protein P7H62_02460 [Vagococcus carniphilus]|uniref:Uncharacterized protein n=1 Tax=Vagococcus carniphilus TaxID=218144 RepID=A0AAW8U3T2_9ENTE|nr:hypothetical protein [Vagococcus carniphilus]MDT2815005.1 hypothetical protein [Vagococcus carniphilus]MDT2829780.1 hypothetical protein [Vagococcus carniphilus]MDT2834193.1 hypothetical protein [Vagococcus carniphilus]MDT2839239.1 hypothetical protein [Vagococcus carniphilus]MDT2853297.1 hypothetical protein [Vagococcus carniphilus]